MYADQWATYFTGPEYLATYIHRGEKWTFRDMHIAEPFRRRSNAQISAEIRRTIAERDAQGEQYPTYSGSSLHAVNGGLFSPR